MVVQLKALAVFTVLFSLAFGQVQEAVLFEKFNGEGEYVIIRKDYARDLGSVGFDNRPRSICLTGIWLLYQDFDFNPTGGRGTEFFFGKDNYCVNINTFPGTISSIRYAGRPKDYSADSLTLYQYDYFQGLEEFARTEIPIIKLIGNHASMIITGSSDWTVYDRPYFEGNSACLKMAEPGTPSFITDISNTAPYIPHGSIRSVRKGCPPSSRSRAPFLFY